ncbi:Vesicle-associated protein 1-3 [Ananas comosus]|uniref:Vesicle-associated protein 1-3 n=1 Tax=Ananas comosus TaxID=4615 RepID=A0A199VYJ7_ANACO|nr:Vesicle-associated protein 1-3 [Ananas comosus]
MGQDLVEIQPRELKFTFELKKQSSCSIQLSNKSDEYVAFKVKTTSPKRYCVRPNTGIIFPRSTCDFTVTMQAQRTAPPDMQLKDKFLVQCTVVPYGSKDEDIVPAFFSKETGRYIEESKLRVTEDVQNMKAKLNNLESKLDEAEQMIFRLREENKSTIQERDKLQRDMVFLKRKCAARAQVGFPLSFAIFMALVGLTLGFLLQL